MAKISIKLAVKQRSDFDLSSNHITTSDFGQLQVTNFLPVVPTDKFHVSVASEARCAPMVVPTFMDVQLVHRSFYVPMSSIYQPFEYFYTDKQDASVLKTMPSLLNSQLFNFIKTYLTRRYGKDVVKPDFSDNTYDYQLTEKGRIFTKLLYSLGYSVNFTASDVTVFSALPLLAFMRVAYDYIYPSQYLDGLSLTKYFKITSASELQSIFNDPTTFFQDILKLLALPYKQDYFTASWQNLNSPGTSVQSVSLTASDGTPVSTNQNSVTIPSGGPYNISAYGIKMLSRLYDFVTRNNIVGTRFADQIFARFGIGSRKSDPDMSQFLGQHIQPIRVVDVTAMSASEGQDLGDLAGKAYTQDSGKLFDFESTDEFGYLLTLTFIMPKVGYFQGRKRWTLNGDRFSFFTPEYDMLMRAIRNDELFADYKSASDYTAGQNYGGNPGIRFSFAPNYSEYKKGDDYISGDFRNASLNENLKSYYLMRDFDDPSVNNPLSLSAPFLFYQQHEFDKIFAQQYVQRVPFNTRENDVYNSLLTYDNKPVILTYAYNNIRDVFVVTVRLDGSIVLVGYREDDDFTHLQELYGIVLTDSSTFSEFIGDGTSYDQQVVWNLFGVNYFIQNTTTNAYVGPSSSPLLTGWFRFVAPNFPDLPVMSRIENYELFLSPYRDYIDHFYLYHRFNIKANRPMSPISEEFMIEDGGNRVSVDMNGNRIV